MAQLCHPNGKTVPCAWQNFANAEAGPWQNNNGLLTSAGLVLYTGWEAGGNTGEMVCDLLTPDVWLRLNNRLSLLKQMFKLV